MAKRALGVLHDVAFVDQRDRALVTFDAVLDRLANQALRAFPRHGFDTDAGTRRKTYLGHAQLLLQEVNQFLHFLRARRVFDARIDVFGVLAEYRHVDEIRVLHGRLDAREIADRAHAGIEIHRLANGDVERAHAAARRRCQRPLDRDHELPHRVQRLVGQVLVIAVDFCRTLTGVNPHPADMAVVIVGLLDCGLDHIEHHGCNIDTDAVAFDVRDDRIVGYDQRMVRIGNDCLAFGRHLDVVVFHGILGRIQWACIVQFAGDHKKC